MKIAMKQSPFKEVIVLSLKRVIVTVIKLVKKQIDSRNSIRR